MKNLKLILILSLSVIAVSVFSQNKKPITLNLAKAINQSPKTVMLSEIASDIRYIPLETRDNCLIGGELSIGISGNDIIAADHQTRSFYRFDTSGKFLNKIGNQGQGPGEYSVGLFYMTDPIAKQIYIQDFGNLFCYDFNGKFIRKITAPNLNMGVSEMLNRDYIIYSNNLYFENKKNPHQLYVMDKNGKETNKWKGFIEEGKRYGIILSSRDFMYTFNGETFFKPALEDVVYHTQSPKKKDIVWKFETSTKKTDVSANETDAKDRGKSISIRQVKETLRYLFVLYGLEQNVYLGMYDKQNNSFSNVTVKDDLAGGADFVAAGKCNDNQLMSVWLAHHIKTAKRYGKASLANRKKELDSIIQKLSEDDNLVVVVVTMK